MAGKYFSLHHRFLAWIGRLTNTIVLCPHPVSIGNASEDYYIGLVKARKEGKKLVVLFPFEMPGSFKIRMFDPAILFLESDLLAMKYRSTVSLLLSGIFTLYFLIAAIIARILIRFFRFNIGYYWRPLAGQDILWRHEGQVKFDWALARDQDWVTQFSTPLELSLPKKMIALCEAERALLGLPNDAWFVCLHVREGGYKGDWDSPLNADIDTYLRAIKEIVKKGGWVVRMGDPSMRKLPSLDKVIDYAHAHNRNALMDVYLMKECRFYLGSSTSLLDTAVLLNKPMVITNRNQWWSNGLPHRLGDIHLYRHVFSKGENRFLSVQEWLQRAAEISSEYVSSPDWDFFDNSDEEILTAVKEMMDPNRETEPTYLQKEFRKAHTDAVQKLSKTLRFDSDELENCNEWFRFSSLMLTWRGEVSAEFLKKNWFKSSKGPI